MKTPIADDTTLARLCKLIRERLDAVPAYDYRDREAAIAHDVALKQLFSDLETAEDAKTGSDWRGAHIRLAGIRSSSTGGIHGALCNWITAARKRIAIEEGDEV